MEDDLIGLLRQWLGRWLNWSLATVN